MPVRTAVMRGSESGTTSSDTSSNCRVSRRIRYARKRTVPLSITAIGNNASVLFQPRSVTMWRAVRRSCVLGWS